MPRPVPLALLVAALLALPGCGDSAAPEDASAPARTQATPPGLDPNAATPPGRPAPPPSAEEQELLDLLVPEGTPTRANGEKADVEDLRVVKRWLAALTTGDIPAAADTFADGALVQNGGRPTRLETRAARLAFNASFPCGAEIVTASSVRGYLVVTYRLTDRSSSPCDGPGGSAAGTIKVEGGRMTEWYRLPNPADGEDDGAGAAPVV